MTTIQRLAILALFIVSLFGCTSHSATPDAELLGSGVFYSEAGTSIKAEYLSNDTVVLTLPDGSTQTLSRAVSGSGARYTAGNNEWWEHQGEATYSTNGSRTFTGSLRK